MSNAATVAKTKSLVPTTQKMIAGAKDLGGVALGIIASHALLNIAKQQNNTMVNGALAVGGFYGAMKVKNPLLKALCIGAGAYGTIKLLGKATNAVSTPGSTEGLSGVLPEKVKTALRQYIPTFAGLEEVAGTDGFDGDDDLSLDDLSLDDAGMEGADEPGSPEFQGGDFGRASDVRLAA